MKIISPKRLLTNVFQTVRNGDIFANSSLDLPFARTKTLDPRITFTRVGSAANAATYVDANGIIQRAVTNLVLNSEDFSNATWSTSNITVTTNAAVAPNGATTADALLETATNADHTIYATSAQTFTTGTQSTYVKPNGRTNAALRFYNAGNDWHTIVFSLTGNGSVTQSSAGSSSGFSAVSSSIVNVGGGWYRISMTATQSSRTTFVWALDLCTTSTPTLDAASGVESYAGDITKGIYVWGAQFQTASTVGEYIQTTSAINSAPRFDHNPTTGESLGLLPEEARTNLLLRSEEFDTASWSAIAGARTVTANQIAAPDGTTTADLVTADGTTAPHFVSQSLTLSAVPCAYSVFAKAGTNNFLQLRFSAAFGVATANFNLATGVVGTVSGSVTSSIQAYPNGWYRCTMVFTPTAATSSVGMFIVSSASASSAETNSLSTSVYLWGAQLEAGATPSSYIPTTSATVTRAADVASITGTNFSSWYNQTEGTVFTEYRDPGVSGTNRTPFAISDGTGNNRIQFFLSGTTTVNNRQVAGAVSNNPSTLSTALNSRNRHAIAAAVGSCNAASNGTLATASTPAAMPVVNRLNIGINGEATGDYLNAPVARITFWPTRLSNEVLQRITQP